MSLRRLGPGDLDEAAALLLAGSVVGIPTDTVYGLAARLGDASATSMLFDAKRRPATLPIAVLCASELDASALASSWPVLAERLAARFWPGPLTIVVAAPDALVASVRSTSGVGVRVPDDALCQSLLARTGPLAVTSANLHGEQPITDALALAEAFDDARVTAVVDDGPRDGEVSTVVDLTQAVPSVLREGSIAAAVRGLLSEV